VAPLEPEVDLVVNTFERTYRETLRPGFFPSVEAQNCRRFARRVVLINNVDDPGAARARGEALLRAGEIDELHFVADHIDRALAVCGLTRADLGRIPHYSDCALVAVTLRGSPWLLYWDAELSLSHPFDWVGPSLDLLARDARVLVANPASWRGEVRFLTLEVKGEFALSYSFSDSVFLVRREELAQSIYRHACPAALRYPLAHIATVFEQRVESFMRAGHRLRASHLGVLYAHPESEGGTYPHATARERLRRRLYHVLFRFLGYSHARSPRLVVNCRPRARAERERLADWERLWSERGLLSPH
jgi:hypothetical protein